MAPVKKKILIVDDSSDNRKVMDMYLKLSGYDTDNAESGEQAISIFNSKKFDAVFMDLHMPMMNGYEAAKEIKRISPYCPILLVSGDSIEESTKLIKRDLIDAYLTKPIDYKLANSTLISLFH